MNISVCLTNIDSKFWIKDLQAAFPDAKISTWVPGSELADFAVVWEPPQQFIDEQTKLQAVFNIGAGVDAILQLKLPPTLNIIRIDSAGMAVQMAEYVCHEIIRYCRKLNAYSEDTNHGRWVFRKPLPKNNFPIGIMGMGILGNRVAKALKTFEYTVNCFSRNPKKIEGVSSFAGKDQLPDFLRASKILVNLLPLTPDTKNILNYDTLSQLQPGGYVINVGRGLHLVDEDLLRLLESGHLSGATLDVFRVEPLPPEHIFWRHPEINITPHIAARILREECISEIIVKIQTLLRGETPSGLINHTRGY